MCKQSESGSDIQIFNSLFSEVAHQDGKKYPMNPLNTFCVFIDELLISLYINKLLLSLLKSVWMKYGWKK